MCGIFGVINTKEKIDEGKVIAARDIMSHRGPDDSGIYFSTWQPEITDKTRIHSVGITNTVALAHRRLSIIDLSDAAHQPMTSEDGRYTIVYNGEIYNFVQIRNEKLKIKSFKTESDTEVILKLYAQYGKDCLQFLRGMFAFAIWDDQDKTLFASRDRFGIKPFYYLYNENEFIFASELKAIKLYKDNLTVNYNALDAFLRTGSVPAPLTIYNEVSSLLPGHYLQIEKESTTTLCMTISKYWEFVDLLERSQLETEQKKNYKNNQSFNSKTFYARKYDDNAKVLIREALLNTVKSHLVADVEVGAFLSGGIDSTAIVSLMRQVGKEKIKTIPLVFPDNKLDESKYARIAAKKYNTEHLEIPIYEKDLLDDFDKIMSVMDQPTIDGINTYFVSKAAKIAGLKVVLSGLGGDELFGGYPSFNLIPKFRRIKNLPFAKMFMKASAALLKNKLPAKAIHYMKNPFEPNAEYKLVRGLFTEKELQVLGWKSNSLQPSVLSPQTTNDYITSFTDHYSLITVSEFETTYYMRNQILRDSDIFSMAHSVELRVPFVDHKLYEAVLPYIDDAYDKNFPKKMLIEAVGDIPMELINRPKMGFTMPFEDWIKNGQLKNLIKNELKNINSSLYINHSTLYIINRLHWSRLWALYIMFIIINKNGNKMVANSN